VLTDLAKLKDHLSRYAVSVVILADSLMPQETRKEIRKICMECKVEVQDFSGYMQQDQSNLTLNRLMEYTSGKVELVIDGISTKYDNGEQAMMAVQQHLAVTKVKAVGDYLRITLSPVHTVVNDLNADWARDTVNKTGEEISFF